MGRETKKFKLGRVNETNQKEDDVRQRLIKIEDELFKIFQKVTGENDILTIDDWYNLNEEQLHIVESYWQLLEEIEKKYLKFYEQKNKFNHNKSKLFAFCLFMSLINPFASWSLLMCFFLNHYFKKDPLSEYDIVEFTNRIQVLSTNCLTFLNKLEERLEKEEDLAELDERIVILEANRIIQKYLDTGELEQMDNTMQQIIVIILQEDLNTNEENLAILLHKARNEFLAKELEKGRILTKKV